MSDEPEAARTLVVTRVFDAPARLVFLAHSKPEHVKRWFGPVGWPLTMCEMDFRVGGRFRFAMTGENGVQNPPFGGEYLEIAPDRRIVYDNAFEEPGSPRMVTALDFDEADGKTTLTMTTVFESQAMHDEYVGVGIEAGINSGLDQLAEVVAALMARES